MMAAGKLTLGGQTFESRLLTGTGKFSDSRIIGEVIEAAQSQITTVALRRVDSDMQGEDILGAIPEGVTLLPNTSGARTADEAVRLARIAREAGCGYFVKIEVVVDDEFLMPDNQQTLQATEILAAEGFVVLPYISPDPVIARQLEGAGAAAVMPLGSPIGSNRGVRCEELIRIIIEGAQVPVIVDAGLGRPSHAAQALEMGADGVLVNTAIATAADPVSMARAFGLAVEAGRLAFEARMGAVHEHGQASSPLLGFLTATS